MTTSRERRRVAITGVGVVSPIGIGRTAFFDGLRTARSGVDTIRSFDAGAFPTRIAGEVRGLVCPTDLPPEEGPALQRDRKSLFALVAGREALTDAFGGASPAVCCDPGRTGVVVAAGLEVFNLDDLAPHIVGGALAMEPLVAALDAAPPAGHMQIPAHLGAAALAREAGAEGLFAVNLSACAAGTQAVGDAARAIRDGACDVVVTGGYDSMVNPLGVGGFCMLGALSESNDLRGGASRPFDARRDGFVLGEGAAIVVLEEWEAARRRGARVYAEVLGYGTSLDAWRVTDPDPEQAGPVAAIAGALADAGLGPDDIDYVNAHGTGTRMNDPAETKALRAVFGAAADRVPVSSTKSQIGHCIGAAGAIELVACLFALGEGLLPATINLEHPDPECDLDYVPGRPRPAVVRRILTNSFGFGGQNASLVLGSDPPI